MKYLILLSLLISTNKPTVIFDFNENADVRYWQVVNDGVMGGLSKGNFKLTDEGNGLFFGKVSLENNGGFSLLRYSCKPISTQDTEYIKLTVKGDGGSFSFRVKESSRDYYSYETSIATSGEWEEIFIPLANLSPVFRGRKLNFGDFQGSKIEEIAILRGNKKAESFSIEIDKIEMI